MEQDTLNSYPRRPHRRPEKDEYQGLRNILNLVFIILAAGAIVLYLILPMPSGMPYFYVCCFIAIIVKGVEVSLRLINKNKRK